jgi:glycosyltransferase involved in cell wall biosynthesis
MRENKMKILYLHNAKEISNAANLIQVYAMCKAMVNFGFEVELSLQAVKANQSSKMDESGYKKSFRNPLFNSKIDKYVNVLSIKKTIKKVQPDFIYVRIPILLKQVINSGKKIIFELHNNNLHQGSKLLNKYWQNYIVKQSKKEKIAKVVCISESLSNFWIDKGIPAEKVITAHDGVDEEVFSSNFSLKDARERLNISLEKTVITYTGSLYKDRKIENILELAKKYQEQFFYVVGGPEKQASYYKEICKEQSLRNIYFTGRVPQTEVPYYLASSDILLALWSYQVPTIDYCSPLKLFEYMAMEKVIVAHAFKPIKEVLTHNENSILVEPDSLTDLVEKVGNALKLSNGEKMAQKAKKDVLEKYTWTKRVKSIFEDLKGR